MLARIGVAVWAAVIFGLSSIPGSELPSGDYSTPGHFVLYLVMGVLLYCAIDAPVRTRAIAAVGLASAYGISDEIHQLFVPKRCADPMDWLVDTAGAFTAVIGVILISRWLASRQDT